MAIRALISDWGGVLRPVQGQEYVHTLAAEWGVDRVELEAVWRAALRRSLIGEATPAEGRQAVRTAIAAHLGIAEDQLVERRAANQPQSSAYDLELLAFIRSLRSRLRTAMLSDAWLGSREEIRPFINEETFDVIVLSAEEGVAKPDPEIYRRTLERLGVEPEEAIFVDDWLPNVEGARALGIHGILFESAQQMRDDILRLLEAND